MATSAFAQTAQESSPAPGATGPVDLEIFEGPRMKDVKPPPYPMSERYKGNEGWVGLNFMIDPQGRPYELAVTSSSGNKAFEQSALEAALKWTFEPASIGGKPIDGAHQIKVLFRMTEPATGVSREFFLAHKRLLRAIKSQDRSVADAELAKIEAHNLYEDAYLNVARYTYYHAWGNAQQQTAALKAAIAGEDLPTYLPKGRFAAALQLLFPLQVSAQDYAGAMVTWRKLQSSKVDKKVLADWKPVVDQIETLSKDERSYKVPGEIESGSSWFYTLFKKRFQIAVQGGHLSEIKLRCDKKYVFFRYDPELQYKVSDKVGACAMELVGEPGTKFELVQS